MIRPNQMLTISAKILKMEFDTFTITGLVRKLDNTTTPYTYEEICGTTYTFTRPGSYDIKMKVSVTAFIGLVFLCYTLLVSIY